MAKKPTAQEQWTEAWGRGHRTGVAQTERKFKPRLELFDELVAACSKLKYIDPGDYDGSKPLREAIQEIVAVLAKAAALKGE
jgi:hypothetical protein